MDTTIVLGHEAKVRINSQPFAVRRCRIRILADEHETGDTESGAFKRQKSGRGQAEVDLEFYDDTTVSYNTAPLLAAAGSDINLAIYPRGLASDPYSFPSFVLSRFEYGIDIERPNEGTLAGKSDNTYILPAS